MAQGLNGQQFVIGIDIDDTLTSYTERLVAIHSAEYGVDPSTLKRPEAYVKWGLGWPGIEGEADYFAHHNRYVREKSMFSGAQVYENAREAISNLRSAGAYVKIITTRFCSPAFDEKAHVVAETARFLLNNGVEYDEFMVSNTKDQIHADVYVDDSPSNVEKFVKAGAKVIVPDTTLYTRPLAQQFNVPLGRNWYHIEEMLMNMLHDFQGLNSNQEALFEMAA